MDFQKHSGTLNANSQNNTVALVLVMGSAVNGGWENYHVTDEYIS